MFVKLEYVKTVVLSLDGDTPVKFKENLEFTCTPTLSHSYKITNVKGDFEIIRITRNYSNGYNYDYKYDKLKNEFQSIPEGCSSTFYIFANVEKEEMYEFTYQFQIPSARLQCLRLSGSVDDTFTLPAFNGLKFAYCVRKVRKSPEQENIEICIYNPYYAEIQGNCGNFELTQHSTNSVDLPLLFKFYREISNSASNELCDPSQASAIDESRQESVIPVQEENKASKLFKIGSDNRFADVEFISSDETKILSHRNILAQSSDTFAQIFEESSEIPVQINAEDFDAETIQAALNYLYDKPDAIIGKETDVFKFAVKYSIPSLIDACCLFFEESVAPSNVCEFIQIGYFHNFEGLKKKCLKTLVEKKKEVDSTKIADLPKNIVVDIVDAFCC